jgi:hypothetical protein
MVAAEALISEWNLGSGTEPGLQTHSPDFLQKQIHHASPRHFA